MKNSIGCLISIATFLSNMAQAQAAEPWHHTPDLVVIGSKDDSRLSLVNEAVSFWNSSLQEIGSGFRLGTIRYIAHSVPEDALQSLSRTIIGGLRGSLDIPQVIRTLPGDITILLGESDFVSFTTPFFEPGPKRIVGIRGSNVPPLTLPNVARNVITHELGHAIGLGHNSDPTKLMCGRPAPCRPNIFRSDEPRIFPLTDEEERQLLEMYPSSWKPS